MMKTKLENKVIESFGEEWGLFDQSTLPMDDHESIFQKYFLNFPWNDLPANAVGMDLGCGSGRWAKLVAQKSKVGKLLCCDPSSQALAVAKKNCQAEAPKCEFLNVGYQDLGTVVADNGLDFAYSLGVLHHVEDTQAGINAVAAKLKPGAPFLIYLYHAFDNRPWWYKIIWKMSEVMRFVLSRLPFGMRYLGSQVFAFLLYWPLARWAMVGEKFLGCNVNNWPLSFYRNKSFYVMRTDALDRLGTQLEKRYTRAQMVDMLTLAGFEKIRFNEETPYWCAIGHKRR